MSLTTPRHRLPQSKLLPASEPDGRRAFRTPDRRGRPQPPPSPPTARTQARQTQHTTKKPLGGRAGGSVRALLPLGCLQTPLRQAVTSPLTKAVSEGKLPWSAPPRPAGGTLQDVGTEEQVTRQRRSCRRFSLSQGRGRGRHGEGRRAETTVHTK